MALEFRIQTQASLRIFKNKCSKAGFVPPSILTRELGLAAPKPALPHLTTAEESVVNVPNELDQLWICGIDKINSSLTKDFPTQPVGQCQGNDDQDKGGEAE